MYYHYPLCNCTHQNRFNVSIFWSSAVQGHESDNGDMYSSESSWGDTTSSGRWLRTFLKKTNMIFNTFMSVTLDSCYEFSFLCLSSLWHSQVSTKHFPQMLCNSLYFWQCQHRSLNSSLGPGVCRLGLWPVSSLLRSIPMLGVFFFRHDMPRFGKMPCNFGAFFFSAEVHQRSQQWMKPGMLMVAEPGKCPCNVVWRPPKLRFTTQVLFSEMASRSLAKDHFPCDVKWFLPFWYKKELGNIDFFFGIQKCGWSVFNSHVPAWKSFIIGMRLPQTDLSSFNEYIATMFRGKLSGPARICSWCVKGHYHVTTFFFLIDLTLLVSADALEILRASLGNWRLELSFSGLFKWGGLIPSCHLVGWIFIWFPL